MIRIELTVLLKPNVKYKNETDPTQIPIDTQYDKLAAIMSALKVRVVKCETEGVKRLAYKIKGFNCAIYTFYELEVDVAYSQMVLDAIDTLLAHEPYVLRHLAIPVDERKLKYQIKISN